MTSSGVTNEPCRRVYSVPMNQNRRDFLRHATCAVVGLSSSGLALSCSFAGRDPKSLYKISLAEWSLHRSLRAGDLDHLDFAKKARGFGIDAVEYVNTFFMDKADDEAYLSELNRRASDHGIIGLLIMCDREGQIGHPKDAERTKTVENHKKWVRAARALGCHSIRVNAKSKGSAEEQTKLAADGLRRLSEYADGLGINVIVENHGGLSSNGQWLAGVMKKVGHPRCGTLPDFGNFKVSASEEYDRYKGIAELMPWAKAVSAKSHDFDSSGNETHTDYLRMMKIVKAAGYRGWVGIEYEGKGISEDAGILATKRLLEKVREELA